MVIAVNEWISLNEGALTFRYIRASGPGGQNVNKVASAVQLRFDVEASPALPGWVKARLKTLAGSRLTKSGVIVIEADRYRNPGAQSGRCGGQAGCPHPKSRPTQSISRENKTVYGR